MINKPVKVLCIGGSDSSGGAGNQADLKAVQASACYGLSVITAVTAQNTLGVQDIFPVSPSSIGRQIESVLSDIGANAVKTGMIWQPEAVRVIAEKIKKYKIKKLVVDPVMVAKGGSVLMEDKTKKAFEKYLLPLALVITPNIPEAEAITKMKIRSNDDMKKAAEIIYNLGVKNVVVKGGHLSQKNKRISVDIFYDGKNYQELKAQWFRTKNTHGTGCTFASLLASGLAQGRDVFDASNYAKIMITKAIHNSFPLGKGHGTVNVGLNTLSPKVKDKCVRELQTAINYLMTFKCGNLIPEVSSNLVYAKENAKNKSQVAGFPGRIIRLFDDAYAVAQPIFGASSHMANVVLTVMKHDPSYRSAMNIKYSEEIVNIAQKAGLSAGSFDRKKEPLEKKEKEGFSLEWGVNEVIRHSKIIPDIIYDTGDEAKEPMIRILGKNPIEVVKKIIIIQKHM